MISRIFTACPLVFSFNEKLDYCNLPLETSNNIFNAVIEIPVGTNKKHEYNKTKTSEIDIGNAKDSLILEEF